MSIFNTITHLLGGTADSRIMAERVINKDTIILNNRSLSTLIAIKGFNSVRTGEALGQSFDDLERMIRSVCTDGSYVQVIYESNPETTQDMIKRRIAPNRVSAENIGLYHPLFFDDQVERLKDAVVDETVYLCLYTSFFLTDTERKRDEEALVEMAKKLKSGGSGHAQSETLQARQIIKRHRGNILNISTGLEDAGLSYTVVTADDAIVAMRKCIEPEFVTKDWTPATGSKMPPMRMFKADDVGQVLFPRIADQVLTCSMKADSEYPYVFKRGKTYVANAEMSVPPSPDNISSFTNLKARLPDSLPVRISYLVGGDGLQNVEGVKSALAAFLSVLPGGAESKRINLAIKSLRALSDETGIKPLSFRCNTVSWGKSMDEASENIEMVVKGFEGWASPKMDLDFANCFDTFFSTIPCNGTKNIAPCAAGMSQDVVKMLPWNRPSTPWQSGYMTMVNSSRLLSFDLGTALQESWNMNIFAPMGKGKSVIMMLLALSVLFKEGNREIPYILFLDIGPSSAGLLRLISNILPEDQRPLVLSKKLQFDPKMSINPLDTWTGARRPLPAERGHMLSVLNLLVTPANSDSAPKFASEILASCLDEVFDRFATREEGKVYEAGVDRKVDRAIEELNIEVDEHTLWWDIIDGLFLAGDMESAGLAQRYAVPLITDVINNLVQSESLRNLYGSYTFMMDGASSSEMKTLDVMANSLQAALRDFQIFSRPTVFSVNNARIVSLNLENVALDPKKTAVMYSVAKQVGARRFYISEEDAGFFPEIYREYYKNNAPKWRAIPKALFIDEKHRTRDKNNPNGVIGKMFDNMVKSDERVGRKYELYIIQASQMSADFDEESNALASTKLILGTNSAKEAEEIATTFGLTPDQTSVLRNKVLRPGQMLMVYNHKGGSDVQYMQSIVNTKFLYAVSTNSREVLLRKTLENKLGYFGSLDAIHHFFPIAGTLVDKLKDVAKVPDLDEVSKEKLDNLTVEIANDLADTWLEQKDKLNE